MLKIISLWTIQKILEPHKKSLGAHAQMIYINCLIFHFQNLEPIESNSVAFEISKLELKFNNYVSQYKNLSDVGLIEIKPTSVMFYNIWSKHIDKSLYTAKNNTFGEYVQKELNSYVDDFKSATNVKELCMRTYKISLTEYERLQTFFIEEQIGLQKTYPDLKSVANHFYNWIKKYHTKSIIQQPIKSSSSKLLGM
jgi:hypothetical protein